MVRASEITIHSRGNKKKELLLTCRLINERALQEKGCPICTVGKNSEDAGVIFLEQRWKNEGFLIEYFRSDHFRALLGAMKWLGAPANYISTEPPMRRKFDSIQPTWNRKTEKADWACPASKSEQTTSEEAL